MEEVKYFTFARTPEGNISILNSWPPVDIEPASSLPRAALFALNWANGGYAGQLDSEDICSYLDTALRGSNRGIPDGFVNSPNNNLALAVYERKIPKDDLRKSAEIIFDFIDTYRQKILVNHSLLENIVNGEVPA